jgi:hypothetical protein
VKTPVTLRREPYLRLASKGGGRSSSEGRFAASAG